MSHSELVTWAFEAFAADTANHPTITLRGGSDLDEYREPSAFDPVVDGISDAYLESCSWGIVFLDASSWRHYLPHLIAYALSHLSQTAANADRVIDALLHSLRPPDREPPRLASLSAVQETVVTRFLDVLAFSDASVYQKLACQVLEEWWISGALYRDARRESVLPAIQCQLGSNPKEN